jgi:putative oxidoreductase
MVGAIAMVHWEHGFFMNWMGRQAGEGFEYHLLVIGMMLALAVLGGGRWSVDGLIVERIRKWRLERDSDIAFGARPSAA